MIKLQQSSVVQRTFQVSEEEFENLPELENQIIEKTDTLLRLASRDDSSLLESITLRKNPANGELTYPKFDKKQCYYQEFWKVFLLNEILISQVKEFSQSNKNITTWVEDIEQLQQQWERIMLVRNKKKVRRTADMIDKKYVCPFQKCGKNYGTDVSLNLHMKIKHNSGTKTDRESLAKEVCLAEERGQLHRVDIYLTFPPGYLEYYRSYVFKAGKA